MEEKYYNELEIIVKKIRNFTCKNCGGNFNDNICNFCGSKDNDLEQELIKLEIILNKILYEFYNVNKDNIKINKLFNLLYTLNDSQECVNDFLRKFNYQENFQEFTKELMVKLNDQNASFSEIELNTIETVIYQKNKNFNMNYIHHYFIQRALHGKQNVSFECFKEIIKQFAESILKTYYNSPECILKEFEKQEKHGKNFIISGKNKARKVWINVLEIEEMYKNQYYSLLITLLHESIHGVQFKNIFSGKQEADPLVILEIKDRILSESIKGYYEENYERLSFEIEADYHAYVLVSKYLNINLMTDELQNKFNNILNGKRKFNGNELDIDDIFNKYIYDHPEILKGNPQLQLLYKIEQNKVVPLNEVELYYQYQKLISDKNISDDQKKRYEMLFSKYINIQENKIKS